MQTNDILQLFIPYIQKETARLADKLGKTMDFRQFEDEITRLMNQLEACLMACVLEEHLTDSGFLVQLKLLAGKLGMRFKEYRTIRIRLCNGLQLRVTTPYFIKATPKRGRKKKGPNGRGKHLGLEVLGILGRVSPSFLSKTVQMALLCPSFAVAKSVLEEQGIEINIKTLQHYCELTGASGMEWRGEVSLDGTENLEGVTVVIGIDGGRLRERRRKKGRRKKGQKRQGFYTDWREPKLFTIYFLNAAGEVIQEIAPVHDATLGNHRAMFALLQQYLLALPLAQAEKLVFCADGAPWIWTGILHLCTQMELDMTKVHQVLDFTHAKQQLGKLLDFVGKRKRQHGKLDHKWNQLLWHGQIVSLKTEIEQLCVGSRQVAALNKWQKYFKKNQCRMQYQTFKEQHIPCGSGSVESAIRRVINLRLKAAGTFWKIEMAEVFLFLRSQLISGRWSIMLRNLTRQMARMLLRLEQANLNVSLFQPRLFNTVVN